MDASSSVFSTGVNVRYVQGIVSDNQPPYLLTNLVDGKTQALHQSQKIWTLGRGKGRVSLAIKDKQLSRFHAAIQYLDYQGFYLIDLDSTNGSQVNGEDVQGRVHLKDGDRIRIGETGFTFFLCQSSKTSGTVPPEVLEQIKTTEPIMALLPEKTSASDLPSGILETEEEEDGTDDDDLD